MRLELTVEAIENINLIERVLGRFYGKIPKIEEVNWWNIFKNCYAAKRETFILKRLFESFWDACDPREGRGLYNEYTHSILMPQINTRIDWLYFYFVLLHELTHGYITQLDFNFMRQVEFGSSVSALALRCEEKEKFMEKLENNFLRQCVDEGIADYVAIQSQKLQIRDGIKRPEECLALTREWMLVNFKKPAKNEKFSESTPLLFKSSDLESKWQELMAKLAAIRKIEGFFGKPAMIASFIRQLELNSYNFGHYLVRSACEDKSEKIGDIIDNLVFNPPRRMTDLYALVRKFVG